MNRMLCYIYAYYIRKLRANYIGFEHAPNPKKGMKKE